MILDDFLIKKGFRKEYWIGVNDYKSILTSSIIQISQIIRSKTHTLREKPFTESTFFINKFLFDYLCPMPPAFMIIEADRYTVISNPTLKVRIKVYDLDQVDLPPADGNMEFYYTTPGVNFAFESEFTSNLKNLENITAGLIWYAAYRKWPHSNFSLIDPRLSIVN